MKKALDPYSANCVLLGMKKGKKMKDSTFKHFNPMKLREKYSAKNRTNNYSSFWMDNDWNTRNTSIFDVDEEVNSKPKTDLVALAGYRRAISNFVTIVTGENIPVTFKTSGKDSFTDGKKVQIGSSLKEGDFDWTVGLALHEGSHIKLSDFSLLKNLEMNVPQELFMRAENMGISRMELLKNIKNVLNYVEDRRIDDFIFKSAPGYKGYYHAMYEKFFYTKVIDKGLLSSELSEESWESYMFRIINLHNNNSRLGALKGLKEISRTIGLGAISRLKSSQDALDVSIKVVSTILDNLVVNKPETEKQEGSESQNGGWFLSRYMDTDIFSLFIPNVYSEKYNIRINGKLYDDISASDDFIEGMKIILNPSEERYQASHDWLFNDEENLFGIELKDERINSDILDLKPGSFKAGYKDKLDIKIEKKTDELKDATNKKTSRLIWYTVISAFVVSSLN